VNVQKFLDLWAREDELESMANLTVKNSSIFKTRKTKLGASNFNSRRASIITGVQKEGFRQKLQKFGIGLDKSQAEGNESGASRNINNVRDSPGISMG
jgi:hypothetical protein